MKRLTNLVFHLVLGSLILAVLILGYHRANAQTAARPPMPNQSQQPFTSAQTIPQQSSPAMPVPDSVVDQARDQNEGYFNAMSRPRTSGQVQDVWDQADPEDAVYSTELCDGCTYKVRTREFMVTVVELPRGEIIEAVDLGDDGGFSVKPRGERRLAVRPSGYGYDTSLVVYGKSGAVYPFYLRAESFNSVNVPDLIVRIEGAVQIDGDPAVPGFAGVLDDKGNPALPAMSVPGQSNKSAAIDSAIVGLSATNPGTPADDFVAQSPFDPNALHGWGDYDLWGDETLRPETVFRDDHFTYIRFGKRWKDVELPTAYVVVDGIDELVNTRVQGETYIIESTRPLITLKSGQSFLCIEYTGDAA
ncbi:hypothetical protein AUP42_01790 [Thalassospira lucentensis]|uniref:ComB2 protein n=1 Tax=Thalassospira lucentensis TaxID=168935 RepID=A0A154L4F5_9PROT|nr:TrbG/VirB9 family P-type conjugative transfer protein [Thalassospira lucentensis]KZB63150.1 hypothetical protein AUP42_01790 [Thalassospira lucentensis]